MKVKFNYLQERNLKPQILPTLCSQFLAAKLEIRLPNLFYFYLNSYYRQKGANLVCKANNLLLI